MTPCLDTPLPCMPLLEIITGCFTSSCYTDQSSSAHDLSSAFSSTGSIPNEPGTSYTYLNLVAQVPKPYPLFGVEIGGGGLSQL